MSHTARFIYRLLSLLVIFILVFQPVGVALAQQAAYRTAHPAWLTRLAREQARFQIRLGAVLNRDNQIYLPLVAKNYNPPVSAPVTPQGGSLTFENGSLIVTFLPGALMQPGTATYQQQSANQMPADKFMVGKPFELSLRGEDGQIITQLPPQVTILPFGQVEQYFVTPTVTIEVAYNDTGLSAAQESRLRLYYRNANGDWVPMLTLVDTAINLTRTPTDHFTEFALMAPRQILTNTVSVVLDPDHGGADPGGTVTSPANYAIEEKVINLQVAQAVQGYLQACGVNVEMTRADDSSLSAPDRATFINNLQPDLAVTIATNILSHSMSYFNGGPTGLADFSKPGDAAFGQLLVNQIAQVSGLPGTRGVHDAQTWGGSGIYLPTHLPNTLYAQIETAYLDSYSDRDNVIDPHLDYLAGGVYNAIVEQLALQAQCPPFSDALNDPRQQRALGTNVWTRFSGQGVNPATGNQFQWSRDLFVSGNGLNLDFTRYYNSRNAESGLFGRGWSSVFDMKLTFSGDNAVAVRYADGHVGRFSATGAGVYQAEPGINETLQLNGGQYILTSRDQLQFIFDASGILQTIQDLQGNTIHLHYSGGTLDWIEDDANRRTEIDTDAAGRITAITDPASRVVTYTYGLVSLEYTRYLQNLRGQPLSPQSADQLLAMTNGNGGQTSYSYDPAGGYLQRVSDPMGISYLENVYTPDGRVQSQKDGNGEQGSWDYQLDQMRAVFTDNEGKQTIYLFDDKYRVIEERDALGQSKFYTYDDRDNMTSMTDKRGNTWYFTYDERGNMLTRTDPRDQWSLYMTDVTTWTYDDKNNPLTMTDALGYMWHYTYDDKGNPTQITEPNGAVTEAHYNDKGLMTWLKDAEGRITTFEYDNNGNRTRTNLPNGGWTTSTYDAAGHQLSFTECLNPPPLGNCSETRTTRFEYDNNGNMLKMTDPEGKDTRYEYDGNNMLIKKTDRRGGVWLYQYDNNLNPTRIEDPLHQVQEFTYDKMNHRLTAKDAEGRVTHFVYDDLYRLIRVRDPQGNEYEYTYDPNGNLLTLTDPLDQVTAFVYDVTNRRKFVHDAIGGTTEYCYDPLDRIIRVFDPRRAMTEIAYDSVGNMTEVTDPLGNRTVLEYDRVHNRSAVITGIPSDGDIADGARLSMQYDALNREIARTDPIGRVTRSEYDGAGNLIAITDPMLYRYEYEYTLNGWMAKAIDPLGGETEYRYDPEGALTDIYDANDHHTLYGYDLLGQTTTITDTLGYVTRFEYDKVGNQRKVYDARNGMTEYIYDELNQLTDEYDPERNRTQYEYDPLRRLTRLTDANGKSTTYTYNPLGWLTSVTDASNNTTLYGYDLVGNRTVITDANGIDTRFEFNFLNQLKREINPLGDVWHYAYDARGNLVRRVDAKWQATYYEYDKADQLTATRYGIGSTQMISVTFEYDANGNETAMRDWNGIWTAEYDALNRRTSATDYRGRTLQWEYDAVGNRTAMIYPDGRRVEMDYDAADRLQTLTDFENRAITWEYDPLGYITAQNNPNGTHAGYVYDLAGRLTSLSNTSPGGTLASYQYTLDAVGNRIQTVEQRGSVSITRAYTYDDLYRLTRAQTNTGEDMHYIYDPVGNRTAKHGTPEPLASAPQPEPLDEVYTYNDLNSMLSAGAATFLSDPNGSRILKTEPLTATHYLTAALNMNWLITGTVVTSYTWDYENRMTGLQTVIYYTQSVTYTQIITGPGGITETHGITYTPGMMLAVQAGYTYDGYGRRVEKWVSTYITATGVLTQPEYLRREYIFDGLDPVVEYESYRTGPTVPDATLTYLYGNGRMVLLERAETTIAGTQTADYWYHYDGLGSVVALTDESGFETCTIRFDEYGIPQQTCPEINRYTYTGQELDEESGLYHFYARYYDAEVGVWVSQDSYRGDVRNPLSLNRVNYVHSNPITYIDKRGYVLWLPVLVIAAVAMVWSIQPAYAPSSEEDLKVLKEEAEREKNERDIAAANTGLAVLFEPYDQASTLKRCAEGGCTGWDALSWLPFMCGTMTKQLGKNADEAADIARQTMRSNIDKVDEIKDSSKIIDISDTIYDTSKYSDELLDPDTWQEAEKMLSESLDVPKNNTKYFVEGMSKQRIPDFVTDDFIADSKFYKSSSLTQTEQLRDFVRLAKNGWSPDQVCLALGKGTVNNSSLTVQI